MTIDDRLKQLVERLRPTDLWRLERFDDVLWETHKDKATMASYTVAGVKHRDIMGLPFVEAMRLGRAVLDGPVFEMVSCWLGRSGLEWGNVRYDLERELWATYRMR